MRINALIPARAGSKRIPNKNMKHLDGLPLFIHSILLARLLPVDDVIFSSDSKEYLARAVAVHKDIQIIDRPPELCTDDATDYGVIAHAVERFPCNLLVYLRPTTPVRSIGVCEQAMAQMISICHDPESAITGLRSVEEMPESAFKCFTMNFGLLDPIKGSMADTDLPNQDHEKTYKPNGYIDIVRIDKMAPDGLWGNACIGFITPHTAEIDTQADWEYAEWRMKMDGYRQEVRLR